ncbi:GDSL-type esterase/lipase family protein [Pseudopedobacter sp.]|uniref:GDSL-type esterase/lipase family protein n=1 Tax=Pseudopedobacter sp. TaxID=1936787 RepID=UPI003342063B
MKCLKYLALAFALFLCYENSIAQKPSRFQANIQKFKQLDSINPPAKSPILLIGSSSFTNWKDVQSYFPDYTIINRGFGGSQFPDLIRHADDVIYPYKPKQIIIYCGDNDLMAKNATPEIVFGNFKTLYDGIRSKLGKKVNITFISIKPSPRRRHLIPQVIETNTLIKNFLKKDRYAGYIDVYNKMLAANGEPIKTIFLKDSLHMNASGYAIWQKELKPALLK